MLGILFMGNGSMPYMCVYIYIYFYIYLFIPYTYIYIYLPICKAKNLV